MITFERAKAIAAILGCTATSSDDEDNGIYTITTPEGRTFNLHNKNAWNSPADRIFVSGMWPQRGKYGSVIYPSTIREESSSISASDSTTNEQVAKDITKRFLPEFERIFDLCMKKLEDDLASENKELAMKKRIMAVMGKPLTDSETAPGAQLHLPGFPGLTYLRDVRVLPYNDTVSCDMRCVPLEIFINLLKSLKG